MKQTNRYYSVKPIVKLRCHVDLWATVFRYVIKKIGGGGASIWGGVCIRQNTVYQCCHAGSDFVHQFLECGLIFATCNRNCFSKKSLLVLLNEL